MASAPLTDQNLKSTVEDAVRDLVCVQHWGDASFVNLPLINPDGSNVTVRVKRIGGGYQVDDAGFTYRDLKRVGEDRSFFRAASKAAEREELAVDGKMILVRVSADELTRAICDVGVAAWQVLDKVFSRISEQEAEIEEDLRERLAGIFGPAKLDEQQSILGVSTNTWNVSAIVRSEGKLAVFQAVGDHANSIYRASAAFHDLAALPDAPTLVSVVRDKQALGPKLSLLAQAGRVIEEGQPDDVYRRAAA